MSEPSRKLLERKRGETTRFGSSQVMPDAVAQKAISRLKLTCIVLLALGGMSLLLALISADNVGARTGTTRPFFVIPIGLAAILAVLLIARSERISALRRLDAGLVLIVLICFASALYRHWLPYFTEDVVRGVSPVPVLLIFAAVVIPMPPRRFLVATVFAVLMDPAALLVTQALGNPVPPGQLWVWLLVPTPIGAAVAYVVALLLHRMNREVAAAREMGSYRLVRHLGAGGMGEVWLAKHRMLARPAALKLIRAEALGSGEDVAQPVLARFEREARATSMLSSPHTIEIYDFGTATDGTFYYVMEYLDGLDLDVLVERHGPMRPARVVHFLYQIAHSLRDAHAAGVIHRDIKPANIFAAIKGLEHDFTKVLDFGLVKFQADTAEDQKLTSVGALVGTPLFMPPEVASGADADARSDLYAVGCVGFWLLTGRHVFMGKTPVDVLVMHIRDTPPSIAELAAHDVPESLERLVLACLEKDPQNRPADAQALMDGLRETGLVGAWSEADSARWWSTHRPSTPDASLQVSHDATTEREMMLAKGLAD